MSVGTLLGPKPVAGVTPDRVTTPDVAAEKKANITLTAAADGALVLALAVEHPPLLGLWCGVDGTHCSLRVLLVQAAPKQGVTWCKDIRDCEFSCLFSGYAKVPPAYMVWTDGWIFAASHVDEADASSCRSLPRWRFWDSPWTRSARAASMLHK